MLGLNGVFSPHRWFAPSKVPYVPCQPCSWKPLGTHGCYGECPVGPRTGGCVCGNGTGELEPRDPHRGVIPSAHGRVNGQRVQKDVVSCSTGWVFAYLISGWQRLSTAGGAHILTDPSFIPSETPMHTCLC